MREAPEGCRCKQLEGHEDPEKWCFIEGRLNGMLAHLSASELFLNSTKAKPLELPVCLLRGRWHSFTSPCCWKMLRRRAMSLKPCSSPPVTLTDHTWETLLHVLQWLADDRQAPLLQAIRR